MLAAITLYSIALFIHITSVIIGLGSTFALSVGFPLALKLDARYLPYVHHLSLRINKWFASPALVLILLTGFHQTFDSGRSFGEFWISATFAIVIVIGGLQGAYFIPTDRKLAAMAERELAGGATTLSDDYQRQAQREGGIGALAGLLIVVAVFLMVTKPGG